MACSLCNSNFIFETDKIIRFKKMMYVNKIRNAVMALEKSEKRYIIMEVYLLLTFHIQLDLKN